MAKIGFIGLGIMGKPMARNMLKKGCDMMVYDLNSGAVAELVNEGAIGGAVGEIGAACDIIFTSLPSGEVVQDVLFGQNGLTSTLKKGALLIDTSSVTPTQAQYCDQHLAPLGIGFLDSPVSGGEPGAVAATLAFMVGGRQADFDRALPYFQMMGSSALLIGDVGAGSIAKLANQVIVNLNIAAVSEALVMATKAGVDPEKVYKAIRGGLAGSAVLDAKAPMMISRNFKPGGKISINHKDIKNVMQTAHALDAPMPMSAQLFEIMQALKVSGHMEDDHSGIVQYFEQLAQVEVRSK